jgi:hypothetical protein
MTPYGIDPATFRFVAQCLNHYAIARPKGKVIPLQALTGPEGFSRLRFSDFNTIGT